ncbi:MAG: M48 family metalloprotease [Pseudomonadota bacterium]
MICAGAAHADPGTKTYLELKEKGLIYNENGWTDYVEAIGHRLLEADGINPDKFIFIVQDDPGVNAFAMPDGLIVVFRGLLPYLRSEDELAGVIGHEIGHILGRHVGRNRRNVFLTNLGGFLGSIATGTSAVWDMTNAVASTIISGYGREYELEADEYGAEFLAKAGYAPYAMIDAIQALKDHELYQKELSNRPIVYHGLFATHPRNDKRLHELVQQVQGRIPATLAEPVDDFWAKMDGMAFGDEAATGLIRDQTYYHGALRIVVEFPEGWSVINTASEVVGRAPGGSQDAVIGMQRQNAPATPQSPEDYVKETLKRDDVASGEALTINDRAAYIGEIEVKAGNAQRKTIGILYYGDAVYVFRGEVGPGGDPETFDEHFRSTMEAFRPMSAEDLAQAKSQRIQVIPVEPGMTYRQLAQRSSIKRAGEETLRVINGHHPNGEPRPGDYVKIVN